MKLLVCGEGASEIGGEDDGVATILLRRLLRDNARRILVTTTRWMSLPKNPDTHRGAIETRKARGALNESRRQGCDGLVLVRDADRKGAERRRELETAFEDANIPCVLGIPIETIEAWVLADRLAVMTVLHVFEGDIPKNPEGLWGKPSGPRHPKFEWNQLCNSAKRQHGFETQVAVAEKASIETLRATCPLGFIPFHDRLVQAFPQFDIVVAADEHWGIGNEQGLPWPRLKGDLAHFKAITTVAGEGKRNAIIMGRKTWESKEVNKRPLPRRQTVVISRSPQELPDGVIGARTLTEALFRTRRVDDVDQIFVVGGAEIYRQSIEHPRLRYAYLTRVHGSFACDTTIPSLDDTMVVDPSWDGASSAEDNGIQYGIERLTRRPGT